VNGSRRFFEFRFDKCALPLLIVQEMARIVLLKDINERHAVLPGKKSFHSFQHSIPNPVSRADETDLFAFPRQNARFLTAKSKKHVIPEFTSRLDDQWLHHGDCINMRISYRGAPQPIVMWYGVSHSNFLARSQV
jgi:hypothetical protein